MNNRRVMTILHFSFLQSFGIFGYDEVVDAVLYVAVHKRLQIVYGIVYAVVGDAALRIIVCTDFGRTVASRNERFAAVGYVVNVLLVLFVVDESAQTCKCALFVLRLVTGFGALY